MKMLSRIVPLVALLAGGWLLFAPAGVADVPTAPDESVAATPEQLFQDRILPIFRSPYASSCTQCHLADIDLKEYIQPSHELTFVALRDGGMINLEKPADSKILKLIKRGEQDDDEAARLIHEKVRRAEFEAFRSWIIASCNDPKLRNAPRLEAAPPAEEPVLFAAEPVAQANKLLVSFEQKVWASADKHCKSCHHPTGKILNDPKKDFLKKYGQRMVWMKREGAAATLKYLSSTKLFDVKQPEKSTFLLKPLNEVEHGGGKKLMKDSAEHKVWLAWLTEYAAAEAKKSARIDGRPGERVARVSWPGPALLPMPDGWLPALALNAFQD